MGINGIGIFLGDNDADSRAGAAIDYVPDLVGPEHVGIGLDYAVRVGGEEIDEILKANPQYWPPGNAYDTPGIVIAAPHQLIEVAESCSAATIRRPRSRACSAATPCASPARSGSSGRFGPSRQAPLAVIPPSSRFPRRPAAPIVALPSTGCPCGLRGAEGDQAERPTRRT